MDNTRPSTVWVDGERPKIGDLATSADVGRSGRALHTWDACPDCGAERWIKLNTRGNLCKSCALRRHAIGEGNNRIENLQLLPNQTHHQSYTLLQMRVRRLENRVALIEAENELLRLQFSTQGIGNPELAEESAPRASVETLYHPPYWGEEKVHPSEKSGDGDASPTS